MMDDGVSSMKGLFDNVTSMFAASLLLLKKLIFTIDYYNVV